MDSNPHGNDKAPTGGEDTLPLAKANSIAAPVEAIEEVAPPAPKQKIPTQPLEAPGEPDKQKEQNPFRVEIVKDDTLSDFEAKTVRFGKTGLLIATLTLIAACIAGWSAFQQFKEMAAQTDLLSRAARQSRQDSASNTITTNKQLSFLQRQITQQVRTLEMEQRPWLEFQPGGKTPPGMDPLIGKHRVPPSFTNVGQPLQVPLKITNIGATTAEKLVGAVVIQVVRDGEEPLIPRHGIGEFIENGKRSKTKRKGKLYPANGIIESTLYPKEISEEIFMPMKRMPDGSTQAAPLTQEQSTGLQTGTWTLYMYGKVWYSDIFGKRHWTQFCESTSSKNTPANRRCMDFGAVDHN